MTAHASTWIGGWRPGDPWPEDVLVLAATPGQALADLEDRAQHLVRRIAGNYATARRWEAALDTIWSGMARDTIRRDRVELRAVLKARRVVRAQVERDADRLDADAKDWAALRAEGLSEAELREAAGR